MIAVEITREFVVSNYIECGLWLAIAIGFAVAWLRNHLIDAAVACIAFAAFGVSDYIETRTGAWWKPFPLLLLKGACLLVFAILLDRYRRQRRRAKVGP